MPNSEMGFDALGLTPNGVSFGQLLVLFCFLSFDVRMQRMETLRAAVAGA